VATEYARRLALREAEVAALDASGRRLGNARLAVAVATLLAGWWVLASAAIPLAWLLIGVAAFAGLVWSHHRVRRARAQADRAAAFYRAGLARIEDRWAGTGQAGDRFLDPHHVYAADLDLFGEGSLFELLCLARTRMGEERLAQWLTSPASPESIRSRQESVTELGPLLDVREQFAIAGEQAGVGVQPSALLRWSVAANRLQAGWVAMVSLLLPAAMLAMVVLWAITGILWPLLGVLLVESAILFALRSPIAAMLQGSESAFEDLRLFADLLRRVEQAQFISPALQALQARMSAASRTIGRLATIVNFAGARRNQAIALLIVPLMYTLLVALAAERWRRLHGAEVATWVDVLADFEALLSLSAYHYEHPEDPFPELLTGAASFEAQALGHPLIPSSRTVRNDVMIGGQTRILLVSGSNMSGKSTLLRNVGINAVLAMAGAPVRARHLRLTPLQVGASIRVNDSLHEGSSRFYAEITRLRQLFDLASQRANLLFLLDELLQGTNSRDRRIGAEGIVRALLARGAIGLISTHDLALTEIDEAQGTLRNVHFQDELRDGRITFDFTLREGVVTKSNAIELMRSVGLEV